MIHARLPARLRHGSRSASLGNHRPVSPRVEHIFTTLGVVRWRSGSPSRWRSLLNVQNFGRRSVDDLLTALDAVLMDGQPLKGRLSSAVTDAIACFRCGPRSLLACDAREGETSLISKR